MPRNLFGSEKWYTSHEIPPNLGLPDPNFGPRWSMIHWTPSKEFKTEELIFYLY